MPKGNAAKVRMLKDLLKVVTTVNVPTGTYNLYLALYATDPLGDNSGTEASYSGYARQAITFNTPVMNGSYAEATNINDIEFPTVPTNSGTISHAAILTEVTGGILLSYGELGAVYSLLQGMKPIVAAGTLTIYEN